MILKHAKPAARLRKPGFVLPDPPPRGPNDLTTSRHLSENGSLHALILHFGNRDTTIVRGERYVAREPRIPTLGRRIPDVIVAFDADTELFDETNGYVISDQGKPPDFVMEVGSRTTGHIDVGEKRVDYASLGIPEYWRFDETGGDYHGAPLAGDRLVGGEYEPIPIETLEEGVHQGYSPMLDLNIRWSRGQLEWRDPRTGEPIPNQEHERQAKERALRAEERALRAEERALRAEERERRARLTAEAQAREARAEAERVRAEAERSRARERENQARIRELEEQLWQARQQD